MTFSSTMSKESNPVDLPSEITVKIQVSFVTVNEAGPWRRTDSNCIDDNFLVKIYHVYAKSLKENTV